MNQLQERVIIKRAARVGPTNYAMGKIYKITNIVNDMLYIGSTCSSLPRRFSSHKNASTFKPSFVYVKMREIGIENFQIVLLEDFPCQNKAQLEAREYEITNTYSKDKLYNSIFNGKPLMTDETKAKMGISRTGTLNSAFNRGCISIRDDLHMISFHWSTNGEKQSKGYCFKQKRTKQHAYTLCVDLQNNIYPLTNKNYIDELPFAEE